MAGLTLLASRVEDPPSLAALLAEHRWRSGTTLVYWEEGHTSAYSISTFFELDAIPWRAARGVVMLAHADWTCVQGLRIIGGHALAEVLVCAMRVPQQIRHTMSLPEPLKRHETAWLMGYAWRLLDEGSSTERLAARLVLNGARASLVAVIAEQGRRRTPVAIMAGERLCVTHHGRWAAAATATLPRCNLLEDKLVTLKLYGGVPRVATRDIDEYR